MEADDGGPVSAWDVRAPADDLAAAFAAGHLVGLHVPPRPPSGRRLRAHRDVDRFTALAVGDRVVLPIRGGVLLGEVAGAADDGQVPAEVDVARRVRWLRTIERARLRFPAALQAPARVFPLRHEPGLAA